MSENKTSWEHEHETKKLNGEEIPFDGEDEETQENVTEVGENKGEIKPNAGLSFVPVNQSNESDVNESDDNESDESDEESEEDNGENGTDSESNDEPNDGESDESDNGESKESDDSDEF